MKHKLAAFALSVLVGPALASAQQPAAPSQIVFPGSVGGSLGTLVPDEPGNVLSHLAVEQGVAPWRFGSLYLGAFGRVAAGRDTDGHAWNNRAPLSAGVRLTHVASSSVLQLNLGAGVADARSGRTKTSPLAYASYWAGWRGNLTSSSALAPHALPGSVSVTSGFVSPVEADNWITHVVLDQGAVLGTIAGFSAGPYARLTAGADTAGYRWNNRVSADGGMKIRRHVHGGVVDVAVAERLQYDRVSKTRRLAPVVLAEFWVGWDPRVTSRR